MTEQELIARLRDGCNLQQSDGERAADRIEELVKDQKQGGEDYCALMEKHDALHVKLAKAVEALRFYAPTKRQLGERWFIQNFGGRDDGKLAAATLAELEGK